MAATEERRYEVLLGLRLREAREIRRLSLKEVETGSGGIITASMLGAYERGEHAITARRLLLLSRFYQMAVEELAEPIEINHPPIEPGTRVNGSIRFEVNKLQSAQGREVEAMRHLVRLVESHRRRRSSGWIELRHEDLVTAAAAHGHSVESFIHALRRSGVLRRPQGRPSRS